MHLLEVYSTSTGSKIEKPFIFEQFFPLVFEKYITIQGQTKFDSKDYSFWQDVVNVLYPILEKNGIKIIQVGGPNETQYQYTIDLRGKTDLNQLAYIIKGSMLHLGSDSLGTHLASHYDIPLVSLYSVSQSAVSGPYFGDKKKQICFEAYLRTKQQKPSYSDKENPKCVDLIRPEEIIDSALLLLGFTERSPFQTFYIGEKYNGKIVRELIPSSPVNITSPEIPVEIRMDIHFDEQVLAQQLSICKGIIVTNKRIDKQLLKQFKQNITALVYVIEENDEPKFIQDIKDLGIPIVLISYLSADKITLKKINYYELAKINIISFCLEEKIDQIKSEISNLYFRSNKQVIQNGKAYMGNVSRIKEEESINDLSYHKAVDCPEFWKDLPFSILVKKV